MARRMARRVNVCAGDYAAPSGRIRRVPDRSVPERAGTGIRPRPGLTWYNASKGAVNLLSKSMAAELAPDGIRVCAIAPVMAETPLLPTFMGGDSPELRAQFKATVPLGRFATIDDVANATLFLASNEASFLTGNVLEVDGGRCV